MINNNSASPPDIKQPQELAFDKFTLESFNTHEQTFWAFMKAYLLTKIQPRQA